MRLIDAKFAQHIANKELTKDQAGIISWVLSHTPTIDAEPVRYGRWIVGLDGSCMCSECNKVFRYEIEYYCPNCGARLDGENE